ncbi:MAG TPA: endonuclease V [Enhygromyxa sp.]|nr:endonuclease V [Enhygromyxa sp.]
MIACIDVCYDNGASTLATAACVVISDWSAAQPVAEYVRRVAGVGEYVSGQFYQRELPCALGVLELVEQPLELIVVDGYVVLDADGTLGMGGHLYDALDWRTPIIGVAKSRFHANTAAVEVCRGRSKRPLFVTALGVDRQVAADNVQRMHGEHRLPTILKRVDRLCRDTR